MLTGPGENRREVVFTTYSPLSTPKNPGLFGLAPPDMSGADAPAQVVLFTGNTYLAASKDAGVSFEDLDSSKFLPKIPGRAVDQVISNKCCGEGEDSNPNWIGRTTNEYDNASVLGPARWHFRFFLSLSAERKRHPYGRDSQRHSA